MNYSLTCDTWGKNETAALMKVIKSRRFTMGNKTRDFEQAFRKKIGSKYAFMTNSGSMANLISMAALFYRSECNLQPGDEVIVPPIAWSTTYYPLLYFGLKLKFVDIDLHTLNINWKAAEKAIGPRTRMIMAVSVLGNPAPLPELRALCDRKLLYLFEDNCESFGAKINACYAGTFGHISTFSTFYSHQLHTIEGGFACTSDSELADLIACIRAHGWVRDLPIGSKLLRGLAPLQFPEEYRFIVPGFNGRPNELNAAIGFEQLKRVDKFIQRRRKNAEIFQKLFRGDERFLLQREHGESSWFSFTIILNPELKNERNIALKALRKAKIEFRLITGGNFVRHNVIRYFNYELDGDLKNANIAHDYGFFVGNYPEDLTDKIKYLRKVLDKAVK